MPANPKVRPFRIGLMRNGSVGYRPIATLGVSRDGGIWISPAPVRKFGWNYGVIHPDRADLHDIVHSMERPKLHYHRSGIVSATLTGADIERRRLAMRSVPDLVRAQALSIVSHRTWELTLDQTGPRKGDLAIVEDRWPTSVGVALSVIFYEPGNQLRISAVGQLSSVGLVADDYTRFAVDLNGHGMNAVIIGRSAVDFELPDMLEPGTTIAALPWTPGGKTEVREAFGLWSDTIRNPPIFHEENNEVLTPDELLLDLSQTTEPFLFKDVATGVVTIPTSSDVRSLIS